jgi:hypothetical protein
MRKRFSINPRRLSITFNTLSNEVISLNVDNIFLTEECIKQILKDYIYLKFKINFKKKAVNKFHYAERIKMFQTKTEKML